MLLKDGETAETLLGENIIIQNSKLYRFTSDSILLSRFARAKVNDEVADFCAGSGVVGLHFLCLNPQIKSLTLYELQPELADMARRSIAQNKMSATVVEGRLQDISAGEEFTLILCNPPYERGGLENLTYEKAICRKEITVTLREVVEISAKKLKFGGRLAIVNRADRLAEVTYLLKKNNLEPKRLQFVQGSEGGTPYLIMVEAVKGGKPSIEILPNIVNNRQNGGCTL